MLIHYLFIFINLNIHFKTIFSKEISIIGAGYSGLTSHSDNNTKIKINSCKIVLNYMYEWAGGIIGQYCVSGEIADSYGSMNNYRIIEVLNCYVKVSNYYNTSSGGIIRLFCFITFKKYNTTCI